MRKFNCTRVGLDRMASGILPDHTDQCWANYHKLQTDNWLLYFLGRPGLRRRGSDRSPPHLNGPSPTQIHIQFSIIFIQITQHWKITWSKTKERRSILGFLKGVVCECESLEWKANNNEFPNRDPRKRNWSQIHKQVVSTLAAAFSIWNLRTERILSAKRVSTYSSPPTRFDIHVSKSKKKHKNNDPGEPFKEKTTRSCCRKAARAQSSEIRDPSCISVMK